MVYSISKIMQQRQFSHTRFVFLLIIVLNTLQTKDHSNQSLMKHRKHFLNDLKNCQKCFDSQVQACSYLFQQIESGEEFSLRQLLNILPERVCQRNTQFLRLKDSKEKLLVKYFYNTRNVEGEKLLKVNQLRNEFLRQQESLQGMQYIPLNTVDVFIKDLQHIHSNLTVLALWHYMINNIQPLIFPLLYTRHFPVPRTYGLCGFSLYQQYAGRDLYNFYHSDFQEKLQISLQLLQAAIKFSYGFANYRLYITDLTADNMVYEMISEKLYFIDLDTIFIVDAGEAKYKTLIHKHEYIECTGCFAYSADEIASYNLSDINIYSACQFLREDLFKDHTKGFLYPIPAAISQKYPLLGQLLNECVDCAMGQCWQRFTVAKNLMEVMQNILLE